MSERFKKILVTNFVLCVFSTNFIPLASAQSSTRSTRGSVSRGITSNRVVSSSGIRGRSTRKSPKGFALFELFTSEGCSSCPPADENLSRLNNIAHSDRIYTLSYHVDYWNYLGWNDPYSDKVHSKRQREYARAFKSKNIYTPQMVVNGSVEFNGSNKKLSDKALKIALEQTPEIELRLDALLQNHQIAVRWQTSGLASSDIINIALVQNHAQQSVNAGENSRKNLSHVNVVRAFEVVDHPSANGTTSLSVPDNFDSSKFHLIGFVQSRQTGQIKNAAKFVFAKK